MSACFFSFPRLHSKYETRDCTAKRPLGTKEVSTNIWKRTENESLLMDGTDHEVEAQNIKKRVDMYNRTPKGFKAMRSQVRDFSRTVVNQKLLWRSVSSSHSYLCCPHQPKQSAPHVNPVMLVIFTSCYYFLNFKLHKNAILNQNAETMSTSSNISVGSYSKTLSCNLFL